MTPHPYRAQHIPELGKSQPEDEHELEGIVEREPVSNRERGFDQAEERENDPVPVVVPHVSIPERNGGYTEARTQHT